MAVLDALCLGQVGEFADLAEMCGSAEAVAAVARTPQAWRLIAENKDASVTLLESSNLAAAADAVAASPAFMAVIWESGDFLGKAARGMGKSEAMRSALMGETNDARFLMLSEAPESSMVAASCEIAGADVHDDIESLAADAAALEKVVSNGKAAAVLMRSKSAMAKLSSSDDLLAAFFPETELCGLTISALSMSPVAMREFCLSDIARAKWMESSYRSSCLAQLRATLADSHGLFEKTVDYWNVACSNVSGAFYTAEHPRGETWYVNQNSALTDFSKFPPNRSVVIVSSVEPQHVWSSARTYLNSLQTHSSDFSYVYSNSGSIAVNRVYLGGMYALCLYNNGNSGGSCFSGKFEIYVPKEA